MKRVAFLCIVVISLASAMVAPASAVPSITDLIGDKDGLGFGVTAGQEFYWGSVGPADGDGTDVWFSSTQSWTHTYAIGTLDGPITSAQLEIFHGGDGWYGAAQVFLNGTSIGYLTDSDGSDDHIPEYTTYSNIANVDVFDLTAYAGLLTGSDTIQVQTIRSGDGWALDYSELTVNSVGSVVPAPGAILLGSLGTGLVTWLRKRRTL